MKNKSNGRQRQTVGVNTHFHHKMPWGYVDKIIKHRVKVDNNKGKNQRLKTTIETKQQQDHCDAASIFFIGKITIQGRLF